MADIDGYENGDRNYEDDRTYTRDRSRSPVDREPEPRQRSRSPVGNGRSDRGPPQYRNNNNGDDESVNPGSNLFVTGIHPRLSEEEVTKMFEKYGDVEKCNIMKDPHTRESRGFGFVKMMTPDQADAARDGLQGEQVEGRTLSIEKARRAKPRTPTPGKYFGPPKRDERPPRRYGDDRYGGDRGYGGGRRDDYRGGGRGGGYRDRYDDRRDGGGRRDDYAPRVDRYSSGRDDWRGGDRRGGGGGGGYSGGYDRPRGPPPPRDGGYGGGADPAATGDVPPPRRYDDAPRRYD